VSRVKESLDADTAAVLLLDRSGRHLIARQGVRPVGQGFTGRIAAEARPIILDHVDHGNVLNPILLEKGIRSLAHSRGADDGVDGRGAGTRLRRAGSRSQSREATAGTGR
jgi:hypothetical protein